MAEKVVIGLDGSAGPALALASVLTRAASAGAEVVADHAIRPLGEFLLDLPVSGLEHWRENLRCELEEESCKPLADYGVRHRTVTVDGKSPAAALTEVANGLGAGMIVVGAQGHGGTPFGVRRGESPRCRTVAPPACHGEVDANGE